MEIFSKQFKYFIKRYTICIILGHDITDWIDEWWCIGHSTGHQVKVCRRCNKELDRNPPKGSLHPYKIIHKKT